ncbi:MAG: hypothetical protein WCR52_09930 [Bacteroidota bacterium]
MIQRLKQLGRLNITLLLAWGMTVLMGILLNMMYFSIKFIKQEQQEVF